MSDNHTSQSNEFISENEALELCHKAVDLALEKGADEAEGFLMKDKGTSVSIEGGAISYASGNTDFGMGVRVIKNFKKGFAYCTDPDNIEDTVDNALSVMELSPEKEGFTLPAPHPDEKTILAKEITGLYDPDIAMLSTSVLLGYTDRLLKGVADVDKDLLITRGGIGVGTFARAIVNSKGIALFDKGTMTSASASTVLKRGDTISTGSEGMSARTLFEIDIDQIARRSGELAVQSQQQETISDGAWKVIFTPEAFSELMEYTIVPAFYGEQALRGESIYSDKIGQQVFPEGIDIIDDSKVPGGLNSGIFDDEGVFGQKTAIIKDGIMQNFLFDITSAREHDRQSTGNGMRAGRMATNRSYSLPPTTSMFNLLMFGQTEQYDSLISGINKGLIVHEVLGAHTANATSGDFSVNCTLAFVIDKGIVTSATKPFMISGNMGELMLRIKALGDDYKKHWGGLTPVSFILPSVLIDGVKIST